MAHNVTVRQTSRATTNSALTVTDNVSVSIADGLGESARRKAIALALHNADTGASATHVIEYNGFQIPAGDYPAGHVF